METPTEVKVWHRGNNTPQLTLMVGACETVVRLTPEQADYLASQLMFQAQFVRHQIKRMRGQDAPVRHHREPGSPCPFHVDRDVTFVTGEYMHPDLPGANYPACRACAPHLPTLDSTACDALNALTQPADA